VNPSRHHRHSFALGLIFALVASLAATTTLHADSTVVFFTDFNGGAPPQISGQTIVQPVGGFAGLGNGGNVFAGDLHRNLSVGGTIATRLTLTGLPPHNSIDINFLLAMIDSWDGTAGPDFFRVLIGGLPYFSENFHNSNMAQQTYVPPALVQLAYDTPLAFGGGAGNNDAAYEMGLDPVFDAIPHTSSSLVIDFDGDGAGFGGGAGDETFGLDNLEVIVNAICEPTPVVGCLGGASASFQVSTKGGALKSKLGWTLSKGDAFAQINLGSPATTTRYTLCVYDETAGVPELVDEVTIEPNPNWIDADPKGYSYKDKTGAQGGVQKAQLKTGAAGKSKVQIKAKGVNLPLPIPFSGSALFDQDTEVTVQLINSDTPTCWTSSFTSNSKNDAVQFKAKAP
jgi:hypothetical protein